MSTHAPLLLFTMSVWRGLDSDVMIQHPGMGVTDVFAALFPSLIFNPAIHLNYAHAVLPMKDGLPKLRGFPSHAGGSGEHVPE